MSRSTRPTERAAHSLHSTQTLLDPLWRFLLQRTQDSFGSTFSTAVMSQFVHACFKFLLHLCFIAVLGSNIGRCRCTNIGQCSRRINRSFDSIDSFINDVVITHRQYKPRHIAYVLTQLMVLGLFVGPHTRVTDPVRPCIPVVCLNDAQTEALSAARSLTST